MDDHNIDLKDKETIRPTTRGRKLELLEQVKKITDQLSSIEDEIIELKKSDNITEKEVDQIELSLKEVETINKHVKDYLDRSLVWMIGIVTFIISILIALLGIALTIIISYLKNSKGI